MNRVRAADVREHATAKRTRCAGGRPNGIDGGGIGRLEVNGQFTLFSQPRDERRIVVRQSNDSDDAAVALHNAQRFFHCYFGCRGPQTGDTDEHTEHELPDAQHDEDSSGF